MTQSSSSCRHPVPHLSAIAISLVLAVGCTDTEQDDDSDPGALMATAEVSEAIGTVVTVRWSSEEPSAGYVEYGRDGRYDTQVWSEEASATSHEVVLFGLKTSTTYDYRVVALVEDAVLDSQEGEVVTSELPAELSQHEFTVETAGEHGGGYLLTPIVSTPPIPVIVDRDGDIVWWFIDPEVEHYMHLAVSMSCDGRSVLFNSLSIA